MSCRCRDLYPLVTVQVSSCLSCPCKFRHAFRVRASFVMPFVSVQVSSCLSCPCISTYLMFPFMFCHASRVHASFIIPLVSMHVSSYLSCPCMFHHTSRDRGCFIIPLVSVHVSSCTLRALSLQYVNVGLNRADFGRNSHYVQYRNKFLEYYKVFIISTVLSCLNHFEVFIPQ